MVNSIKISSYSGHEYATGRNCLRWFCFGGEVDRHHLLLQERGALETWVLENFKNLTSKMEEVCNRIKITKKHTNGKFQYSPETYALNFASEHEHDENGDLLHSFSTRYASRMAAL